MPCFLRSRAALAVCLAAQALVALPAGAEQAKDRARKKMKEGVALFDKGDLRGALARFEKAYEIYPSPKIFLNVAACHAGIGDYVEALAYYERFLAEASDAASDVRADAERSVAEMRGRVGEIDVVAPEGAAIEVNGRRVGLAPAAPSRHMPGTYTVRVAKVGYREFATSLQVEAARTSRVQAVLEPEAAPATPVPDSKPAADFPPPLAPPLVEPAEASAAAFAAPDSEGSGVEVEIAEAPEGGGSPSLWLALGGGVLLAGGVAADVVFANDGSDGASDFVPVGLYLAGGALVIMWLLQ